MAWLAFPLPKNGEISFYVHLHLCRYQSTCYLSYCGTTARQPLCQTETAAATSSVHHCHNRTTTQKKRKPAVKHRGEAQIPLLCSNCLLLSVNDRFNRVCVSTLRIVLLVQTMALPATESISFFDRRLTKTDSLLFAPLSIDPHDRFHGHWRSVLALLHGCIYGAATPWMFRVLLSLFLSLAVVVHHNFVPSVVWQID